MLRPQSRRRDPDKHLPGCYEYVPLKKFQSYLHVCCLIPLIFPSLFPPFSYSLNPLHCSRSLILFSPSLSLSCLLHPHLSIYLLALTELSPWMLGQLLAIFERAAESGETEREREREREKERGEMETCLVTFSELSLKMRPDSRPFCQVY